jgi:hypothetical protein
MIFVGHSSVWSINGVKMIQYRRALQYSAEDWAALDRLDVNPMSAAHTGMLADLLMCNRTVIDDAIAKVGPNVGAIRRWIAERPRPQPKPSRWRRRC